MKTIKFLQLFTLTVLISTVMSCVQGDEYEIPAEADPSINPALGIENAIANGTLELQTISQVKDFFISGEVNQISSDIVVSGYVVSSDETGNFYQEFYMQDSPSNPTAGIKVVLNVRDNYITYNIGRKVYIKLKDLYIGETNNGDGVIAIGGKVDDNGTEIDAMTDNQVQMHIVRSNIVETIVPLELTLQEINDSHIGTFVMATNVEFADNLDGEKYFDPTDQYDSQRTLQTCGGFDYTNFIVETSEFASFSGLTLPNKNGNISGIISKTYNGSDLVMAINTPNDVNMTNSRCSLLDINDFTVLYEEDFNTSTNYQDLNTTGWTNYAETGSRVWRERVYNGNGYAEFSAYNSGDNVNEGWLISPSIDLDGTSTEFLNFFTAQHHLDSEDNTLEVFISTDFDGTNVLGATWQPITANIVTMSNSWYSFVDSGLVDLSSYSGNIHVGFKFTGSGTDQQLDGSYHVEDFKVLAN